MEITPRELKSRLEGGEKIAIVDVREPAEVAICSLANAKWIPLKEILERIDEIKEEGLIVLYCHHGLRSMQAALMLTRKGIPNVVSLRGGIDAWAEEIDPSLARY